MKKRMIISIILTVVGVVAVAGYYIVKDYKKDKEMMILLQDTQLKLDNEIKEKSSLNDRINELTEQLEQATETLNEQQIELENANAKIEAYKSTLPEAVKKRSSLDRGGNLGYKKVYEVEATAYHTGEPGVGTITASGTTATLGRTVAVDRRLIPLGSKLYIEFPDMPHHNGEYIAEDVGGAIKGNIIDLYVDGPTTARNFGRRRAIVYVLS